MKSKTRIYLPISLSSGNEVLLDAEQSHYLISVLRLKEQEILTIFNGIDGEYLAIILEAHKKKTRILLREKTKSLLQCADFTLLFALIKKAPMDYLVQKCTEIGVGVFQPILTEYTVIREINLERLEKVAIEAAEQCGLTAIPKFKEPLSLKEATKIYQNIAFCDESMDSPALVDYKDVMKIQGALIGPEGGFSQNERDYLKSQNHYIPVGLGKRILRAETAAITASSLIILSQENRLET